MQVSMDGQGKFISVASMRNRDGENFYRFTCTDEENQVVSFYCDREIYDRAERLVFGDDLSLVFKLQQWRNGINCRLIDFIAKKKGQ